jgi:hypothetical protein
MSSPQTCGSGLHSHFITRLLLRLTVSYILSQHSTSTRLPEPGRPGFAPKGGYKGVFGSWTDTPSASWGRPEFEPDWVLTSLMSEAPRLVPEPFQVPLCNWNPPPWLTKRGAPSPRINMVWLCLARQPSLQDRDTSQWQGGENITLQIPGVPPEML